MVARARSTLMLWLIACVAGLVLTSPTPMNTGIITRRGPPGDTASGGAGPSNVRKGKQRATGDNAFGSFRTSGAPSPSGSPPMSQAQPDDKVLASSRKNPLEEGLDHCEAILRNKQSLATGDIQSYPDIHPTLAKVPWYRDKRTSLEPAQELLQTLAPLVKKLVKNPDDSRSTRIPDESHAGQANARQTYWTYDHAYPSQNTALDYQCLLNPIDGIIIRASEIPAQTYQQLYPVPERPLLRESALIQANWMTMFQSPKVKKYRENMGMTSRLARKNLRWLVDAQTRDEQTLAIIADFGQRRQAGQGTTTNNGNLVFPMTSTSLAGDLTFTMLLGTPSGRWAAELLYMFNAKDEEMFGRQVIKSVAFVVMDAQTQTVGLVWEIAKAEEVGEIGVGDIVQRMTATSQWKDNPMLDQILKPAKPVPPIAQLGLVMLDSLEEVQGDPSIQSGASGGRPLSMSGSDESGPAPKRLKTGEAGLAGEAGYDPSAPHDNLSDDSQATTPKSQSDVASPGPKISQPGSPQDNLSVDSQATSPADESSSGASDAGGQSSPGRLSTSSSPARNDLNSAWLGTTPGGTDIWGERELSNGPSPTSGPGSNHLIKRAGPESSGTGDNRKGSGNDKDKGLDTPPAHLAGQPPREASGKGKESAIDVDAPTPDANRALAPAQAQLARYPGQAGPEVLASSYGNPLDEGLAHLDAIFNDRLDAAQELVERYPSIVPKLSSLDWNRKQNPNLAPARQIINKLDPVLRDIVRNPDNKLSFEVPDDSHASQSKAQRTFWTYTQGQPKEYVDNSDRVEYRYAYLLNPVDGIIVRNVNVQKEYLDPAVGKPLRRESALVLAEWAGMLNEPKSRKYTYRLKNGKQGLKHAQAAEGLRSGLCWLVDAVTEDAQTLAIMRDLLRRKESEERVTSNVADPDVARSNTPDRNSAGLVKSMAGELTFTMLMGTPSGRWAAELLYMYNSRAVLHRKFIKGVGFAITEGETPSARVVWEVAEPRDLRQSGELRRIHEKLAATRQRQNDPSLTHLFNYVSSPADSPEEPQGRSGDNTRRRGSISGSDSPPNPPKRTKTDETVNLVTPEPVDLVTPNVASSPGGQNIGTDSPQGQGSRKSQETSVSPGADYRDRVLQHQDWIDQYRYFFNVAADQPLSGTEIRAIAEREGLVPHTGDTPYPDYLWLGTPGPSSPPGPTPASSHGGDYAPESPASPQSQSSLPNSPQGNPRGALPSDLPNLRALVEANPEWVAGWRFFFNEPTRHLSTLEIRMLAEVHGLIKRTGTTPRHSRENSVSPTTSSPRSGSLAHRAKSQSHSKSPSQPGNSPADSQQVRPGQSFSESSERSQSERPSPPRTPSVPPGYGPPPLPPGGTLEDYVPEPTTPGGWGKNRLVKRADSAQGQAPAQDEA